MVVATQGGHEGADFGVWGVGLREGDALPFLAAILRASPSEKTLGASVVPTMKSTW